MQAPTSSRAALFRYPVTPKMNKASFNTPEAIRPLEPAIAA
jgi:hypothetical protein